MEGKFLTRVDFKDDRPAEYRTAITDGETTILLNPETEEISCKIVSDDSEKPAYRIFSNKNYLSRINLSTIREEARRIALDIQEDNDTVYSVSVPNETIRVARGDRVISNRISFDVKDEVLSSMESVTVTADGSRITMTVTPMYEKKDGVPIKIGQTTVVKHDIPRVSPQTIEGNIYHSPDDIPTLSGAKYEELSKAAYIEKNDTEEFNKLRGVVTISGANRGFKALEGGIPVFRAKLYNVADTLGNGLKSIDFTGLSDIVLPSTE
jgi:hypothetical protein